MGFSLLEMLAALAIISAASLALFQSVAFWVRISGAASQAAGDAVANTIDLVRFQALVGGLYFAWPERPDEIFSGEPSGFRGLTRRPLHFADPGLEKVEVRVARTARGAALAYSAHDVDWTIALAASEGDLRFSYLGIDGVWRPVWPPPATPMADAADDPALFRTPQLPLAIRLSLEGPQGFAWIADVGDDPTPPGRNQDLLDGGGDPTF